MTKVKVQAYPLLEPYHYLNVNVSPQVLVIGGVVAGELWRTSRPADHASRIAGAINHRRYRQHCPNRDPRANANRSGNRNHRAHRHARWPERG